MVFYFCHASLADLMMKRQRHKRKTDAALFEFADVANA